MISQEDTTLLRSGRMRPGTAERRQSSGERARLRPFFCAEPEVAENRPGVRPSGAGDLRHPDHRTVAIFASCLPVRGTSSWIR